MMKNFFTSMLGALAAIWISLGILFILCIFTFTALIASSIKKDGNQKIEENSILYLDLNTTVSEEASLQDFNSILYNGKTDPALLLQPTLTAIENAATDNRIKGIYINAGIVSAGTASAYDLANAIDKFRRESGKWVVAYGETVNQKSYLISSGASEFFINPEGMIQIEGLTGTVMFYTGLLEKLGVGIQVFKVGTFKSAVEPFMLKEISPANRMQMEQYMGSLWDTISEHIASERGITRLDVNNLADSLVMTYSGKELVQARLADATMYLHEVEDHLRGLVGVDKEKPLPLIGVSDYYEGMNRNRLVEKDNDDIVVLYATGDITTSDREGIASDRLVPIILKLAERKKLKGMVLRVNSPGGSAYASEQIWEALEVFKESGKSLYVSMGDYAASGGYYISCGADRIFASPVTLTGSIGIFGIVPNVKGLLNNHLGITVSTVTTNANGSFPPIYEPLNSFEQAAMQRMINRGYETFVGRCADGRHMSVDSIKEIAEGRVWAAPKALEIGLVDQLGNLDDAVEALADELGLTDYKLGVLPEPKLSMFDYLISALQNMDQVRIENAIGPQAFEYYQKLKKIEEMERVQCRMEEVEIEF